VAVDLLLTLIDQYGLWLVAVNVLALQLGAPVPAYPTLLVVGAAAARAGSPVWPVVAVATAASLVADLVWYRLGATHGRSVLRTLCRISQSPDSCMRQTERIYERWGAPALLVAKFVPGFAAVATSMAGLLRTRLAAFLAFDAVGAALWSGAAVALGWLFRDAVGEAVAVLDRAGRWGLALLAAALAAYVGIRYLRRHLLIRSLRMGRIDVDDLSAMLARGERPLVIDVRSPASHATGRIPGAVWIDSEAFDTSLDAQGLRGHAAPEVIVYCACPNEESAALVARKLMRAGFRRVRPLGGGIEAWVERGYALEMPADAASA
jgi:membrane protein DedA with SNARE-associated domain/rhodanese-related sulfurtransferase